MANPKERESDKKTGDKFEPLIDRASGGSDRTRKPQSERAGAGKKDPDDKEADDEDDVELDDDEDDEDDDDDDDEEE